MPIYTLWRQATGSPTAATILLVALILVLFFVVNAMQQTASHLIWALGRDNALLFSTKFARMHSKLHVPVWGLLANSGLIFVAGCIYLGSAQAFNALVNSSIILQIVSFAIPCALLLSRKRSQEFLPRKRAFWLPQWLGWVANIMTIVAAVTELVFFNFPTALPVTAANMSRCPPIPTGWTNAEEMLDYTCAVLGVIAMLGGLNWLLHARKHYQGPRVQAMGFH